MIKTTDSVIIMTSAELEAVIDASVKRAVAGVMERVGRIQPPKVVAERGGNPSLIWVRAERYCELSGEPLEAVYSRIRDGLWAAGKHYKRTSQRTLWINVNEAQEWIGCHLHVEAVVPSFARQSARTSSKE